eukprot:Rmarinus@m.17555
MVRLKHRYLLCEIYVEGPKRKLPVGVFLSSLRDSIIRNFGDIGIAQTGHTLAIKFWDSVSGLCVVRCNRETARNVWASLTSLTQSWGSNIVVKVLRVSGSVRTGKPFYLEFLEKRYAEFISAETDGKKQNDLKALHAAHVRKLSRVEF